MKVIENLEKDGSVLERLHHRISVRSGLCTYAAILTSFSVFVDLVPLAFTRWITSNTMALRVIDAFLHEGDPGDGYNLSAGSEYAFEPISTGGGERSKTAQTPLLYSLRTFISAHGFYSRYTYFCYTKHSVSTAKGFHWSGPS